MFRTLLGAIALAGLLATSMACGDDDDGGGGGCAHAQMLCESDSTVEIDCNEFDSAPSSVKSCVASAASCDAVFNCLVSASGRAGDGS